jgi:RNA polymerase sporulation-specific sigma factor
LAPKRCAQLPQLQFVFLQRVLQNLLENGRAMNNTVLQEVEILIPAVWLMLGSLLYSLQLSSGSFPRPLTAKEEAYYLDLASKGDLEARNILVERNLRLVAHIMNKS